MNFEDFLEILKRLNNENIQEEKETLDNLFKAISPTITEDSILENKFSKIVSGSEIKDEYFKYFGLITYYNLKLKESLKNERSIVDKEYSIAIENNHDNITQKGYINDYVESIYGIRKCIEKYPKFFDYFKKSLLEGLIEKHKNELLSTRKTNKEMSAKRLNELIKIYIETTKNKLPNGSISIIDEIANAKTDPTKKIQRLKALKKLHTEYIIGNTEYIEETIDGRIKKIETIGEQTTKTKDYTGITPFEKYSIEDIIEIKDYIINEKIQPDPTCSKKYQELQRIAGRYIVYVGSQLDSVKERTEKEKKLKRIEQQQKDFIDKIRNPEVNLYEDDFYPFRELFTLNMLERVLFITKNAPKLDKADDNDEEVKENEELEKTAAEEKKIYLVKRITSTIKGIPELDITNYNIEEVKEKKEVERTPDEKRKMKLFYGVGVLELLINEIYEKYKEIKKEEKQVEKEKQKRKEGLLNV